MFGVFKTKSILSAENIDFQIASFKWLLKYFGGKDFYDDTQLVLPTRQYFPSKVETEEEAANNTFLAVKKYAGMEEWPCKLEKQEEDINPVVAPTVVMQNVPSSPHGTFELKDRGKIVITYNPSIVSNPTLLVATYAHELAHYLTSTAAEEPPGGMDNWEFVTDIAGTFLGFGIFMANSAFNFHQYTGTYSQGWKTNRTGYLSEEEHIYALGIFLALKDISIDNALPYLKGHLKVLLKKAKKQINKSEIIEDLKKIKCES